MTVLLIVLAVWFGACAVLVLVLHVRGKRKLARARARLEDLAGRNRVGL